MTKISEAIRLFMVSGDVVELRAIGDHIASGYYDDPGKLAADAERYD